MDTIYNLFNPWAPIATIVAALLAWLQLLGQRATSNQRDRGIESAISQSASISTILASQNTDQVQKNYLGTYLRVGPLRAIVIETRRLQRKNRLAQLFPWTSATMSYTIAITLAGLTVSLVNYYFLQMLPHNRPGNNWSIMGDRVLLDSVILGGYIMIIGIAALLITLVRDLNYIPLTREEHLISRTGTPPNAEYEI